MNDLNKLRWTPTSNTWMKDLEEAFKEENDEKIWQECFKYIDSQSTPMQHHRQGHYEYWTSPLKDRIIRRKFA